MKYVFAYNNFKTFLKGFIPLEELGSKVVFPLQAKNKLYVWRNTATDNHKVGVSF
jgi:hypothetical protein